MQAFIRATPRRLGAVVILVVTASAVDAQRARERSGSGSVTDIIDARRFLDLTPRQLAQLDSIERAAFQARSRLRASLQARRDSMCANRNPCNLSREERAGLLDWADSQRPTRAQMLRSDSIMRNGVMAVLDSTQRARLGGLRSRRSSGIDGPRALRRGPAAPPPAFRGQRPGLRGRPMPGFRGRDDRMRPDPRFPDRPHFGGRGDRADRLRSGPRSLDRLPPRGRFAPPGPPPDVMPRQRRRPEG